jgi:O-antigen/teichoic acid export membrane protein
VSLMFSPFVADLHSRGETAQLDRLFKSLTRWTLAATVPAFLLLLVAPGPALNLFGAEFAGGRSALLILLAGQFINVLTGSVGFVLIMVGRTGWDLIVYAASLAVNLALAFLLSPKYGIVGAAIANSVTFALSKWARLALVRRFVGIQPYNRDYVRLVVPTLVGGLVMWAVHRLGAGGWLVDLISTGVAGSAAYAGAYLALGLTPAERRGLMKLMGRVRARRGSLKAG